MKAVARAIRRNKANFYASTLAPVDRRGEVRFRTVDMVMLSVLFLELALLMRWSLAT